jgi:hypothetical protein
LLAARVAGEMISVSYESSSRAVALLDRRPARVSVDGSVIEPDLAAAQRHWSLRLPRGRHTVALSF